MTRRGSGTVSGVTEFDQGPSKARPSMSEQNALHLAQAVLTIHALVALFVIFGLVAILFGARLAWPFVYSIGWRSAHLGVVAIIAVQKVAGATCFLSVWEFDLLDRAGYAAQQMPAAQSLLIRIMHWDMPLWFFTALYLAVLACSVVLWYAVPPRRPPARGSSAD